MDLARQCREEKATHEGKEGKHPMDSANQLPRMESHYRHDSHLGPLTPSSTVRGQLGYREGEQKQAYFKQQRMESWKDQISKEKVSEKITRSQMLLN